MHPNTMALDQSNDCESVSCQPRSQPIVHPPVESIACSDCRRFDPDVALFDPKCAGCQELLYNNSTNISQLFALLRQWSPRTQQHAEMIIRQMLKAGAHVDDRDGLTDMTMLQYACKSGARGVGTAESSCQLVGLLLSLGADPYVRCRWTNMAAIHYAAYFDVASVIEVLVQTTKGIDIDSPCSEFDNGTPLHVAARNLAVESATVLLYHGAHPHVQDSLGKMPIDWVPDPLSFEPESESAQLSSQLITLLSEAQPSPDSLHPTDNGVAHDIEVTQELEAIGVKIGDRVVVGGAKSGMLRYCGKTLFANGLWAGIELDDAAGKNNGSIDGIPYFRCPPNYGIFAPLSKIAKPGSLLTTPSRSSLQRLNYGKVDVAHVTAKVDTGLKQSRPQTACEEIEIGDRVLVAGKRTGIVRFVGPTDFASGIWYGIELSKAVGKNDGSVNGKRYFSCTPQHGVFAPSSRLQKMSDGVVSPASTDISTASYAPYQSPVVASQQVNSTPLKPILRTKTLTAVGRSSMSAIHNASSGSSEAKLSEGTTVFCSGEMGVVRYIGPVNFADGVWLGVELKTARGKHDGSVQGRRYFTCTPGHGLLVRPGRVSVRGISGAHLRLE